MDEVCGECMIIMCGECMIIMLLTCKLQSTLHLSHCCDMADLSFLIRMSWIDWVLASSSISAEGPVRLPMSGDKMASQQRESGSIGMNGQYSGG